MGRPFNLFLSEYLTTAMGMPFEVGKTLLQIEYRPRRRFESLEVAGQGVKVEGENFKEKFKEEDELSNPEEADMYFTDRLAQSSEPIVPATEQVLETDAMGYFPDCEFRYTFTEGQERSKACETIRFACKDQSCWREVYGAFLSSSSANVV